MSERPDEFELKPRKVAAKRYAQKRDKKERPVTGMDLAWYFAKNVPGITHNIQALAGTFARWRKSGLSSEKIRAMIDLFVEQNHDPSRYPAWRFFIYQREALERMIDKQVPERDRDDPIFQTGRRN